MVNELEVKNFRCFEHVHLTGLKRITVIVGGNGSGKTSLLEAVFLAITNSPAVALRLRGFRSMGQQVKLDAESSQHVWSDLFHNQDPRRTIQIDLRGGSREDDRSVQVVRADQDSLTIPLGIQVDVPITSNSPMTFTWKDARGVYPLVARIGEKGMELGEVPISIRGAFFPSQFALNPEETAGRFSILSKAGGKPRFLKTFQSVFPEITDITVEIDAGSWMVYVRPDDRTPIPVALYSGAANRLIAILLAIAEYDRGIVLVDEAEDGIHYSAMPRAWQSLYSFATHYKTQLLASTHSAEGLRAVADCMKGHERDFAFIRTTRKGTPSAEVQIFSGSDLENAVLSGYEVR